MIKDKLIAHRGWRHRYPENTLPGINAAIDIGAQHIEIDIQLTSDGTPVLCHDSELQRLCGSNKNINHSTLVEISQLSAHEPERLGNRFLPTPLPTLQSCVELIDQHADITLYVELKTESIALFGADAVLDAVLPCLQAIADRCFLISFNTDILQLARRRGWKLAAAVLSNFQQAFSTDIELLSPELLFCDKNLLSSHNTVEKLPYPTAFYEVTSYQQAAALLAEGAYLIETFSVGELIDASKKHDTDIIGKHGE